MGQREHDQSIPDRRRRHDRRRRREGDPEPRRGRLDHARRRRDRTRRTRGRRSRRGSGPAATRRRSGAAPRSAAPTSCSGGASSSSTSTATAPIDDHGDEYGYEKLLLATGGRPRELDDADDDVVYFRTLDDYRALRSRADEGASFIVIGGGFIGSEIAAALDGHGRARDDGLSRSRRSARGSSLPSSRSS